MTISYDQVRVQQRKIKDPIHDYIDVDPIMAVIIDSEHFQRLRNIKQLGTTSYVWPSASHSRFEHCLGVAHLARKMATHLQSSQPSLEITDRDVMCVTLAGLCHDLGHGPWSHVFDGLFIPKALPGREWHHEDGSELMFDDMVETEDIRLPKEDLDFIKALVAGDPGKCSKEEKPFLFDIVANKRNGLDVDKFDYIQRDFRMIGDQNSISVIRLIHAARVLDNQICYDIKDVDYIYELCQTRFKLHKIYYNHKSAKAIEYMIIDALLAAEPHLKIAEQVFDPKRFLHLTDVIMPFIEMSPDPALEPAKAIFRRVRKRQLYRVVEKKVVPWQYRELFRTYVTPERIVEEARKIAITGPSTPALGLSGQPTPTMELSESDMSVPLTPSQSFDRTIEVPEVDDVIVDFSTMHYGMKEKNPLKFVKFYSKRHPNVAREATAGDYSGLMPEFFAEDLLRIFSKKQHLDCIIQCAFRALLKVMEKEIEIEQGDDHWNDSLGDGPTLGDPATPKPNPDPSSTVTVTIPRGAPTPPLTEAPSTPKPALRSAPHSRSASLSVIQSFGARGTTPGGTATLIEEMFAENEFMTIKESVLTKRKRKASVGEGSDGGEGGGPSGMGLVGKTRRSVRVLEERSVGDETFMFGRDVEVVGVDMEEGEREKGMGRKFKKSKTDSVLKFGVGAP